MLFGFLQCKMNGHFFENIDMELGLVFRPVSMKGQSHQFEMSSPSILTGTFLY